MGFGGAAGLWKAAWISHQLLVECLEELTRCFSFYRCSCGYNGEALITGATIWMTAGPDIRVIANMLVIPLCFSGLRIQHPSCLKAADVSW